MKQPEFNVADLLADESFQRWALDQASHEEHHRWETWVEKSEEHRRTATDARRIVKKIQFRRTQPDVNVAEKLSQLQKRIRDYEGRATALSRFSGIQSAPRLYRFAVAIILVFMIGSGAWLVRHVDRPKVVTTEYGERANITLPDGSTITLNGHSSLKFNSNWFQNDDREVSLEGEAFFSVLRMQSGPSPVKFLVHTTDGTIRVLGTQFNVTKWEDFTQVVLSKGKVEVMVANAPEDDDTVVLRPNDLVEFRANHDSVLISQVNSEVYSSWKTEMLMFDHTPVRDILKRIRHTYGMNIEIEDAELLDKRISGKIENRKEVLLKALASLLNREVHKENGRIFIK
ncbi:MAG: FecR family protein [bacterium]